MKNYWLILSLFVLCALIVNELTSKDQTNSPPIPKAESPKVPSNRPHVQEKENLPVPLTESTAPAATSQSHQKLGEPIAATKSSDGRRAPPPPNSVPFELHGDLVVSYGDVLLGRPTMENFPQEGFIEAPKVQSWKAGEIAFSIDPQLPNPERVHKVIAYFNHYTPVRLVPYTNQRDSIVFSPTDVELCLSYVGRIGGHQPIYLDYRCGEKEIIHELMHALGFIHEHSRPDRDQYVRVNWDKIEEDKQSQFEAAPASMAEPHKGRPFDYQSVMIYDPTDFAKQRGDHTLESLTGAKIEPVRHGISQEDLARLVEMYGR